MRVSSLHATPHDGVETQWPSAGLTILDLATSFPCLRQRPRGHPIHQHLSQAPHPSCQASGHGGCPLLPSCDGPCPFGHLEQGNAQARVGQHEVVVCLKESQLMTQPSFVFAQRGDPTPDRRHMLAKIQIEALDKAWVDLPPSLGQDRLDGLCRAEYDTVCDPDDVPAPVALDHLRLEQPGQRHPAWLGLGPFVMTALGLEPAAVVGNQRGEIFAKPIGEK